MSDPASRGKIVDHFLLSSPPGEIKAVAADLDKFLGSDTIPLSALVPTFRQYNVTNTVVVNDGNPDSTTTVVLAAEGEVGDGVFVDTKRGVLVNVSHPDQKIVGTTESGVPAGFYDPSVEPLRLALVDSLSKDRLNRAATIAGFEVYSRDNTLLIVKSALALNLRNFWTGAWRSRWTVSLSSPSSATVSGSTHITTHYFENGNLQMNSERAYSSSVSFTDAASFATAVIGFISTSEDSVQSALDVLFEKMGTETLKDIRRALPFSQKKMDWNVAAHRMTKTLRK